MNTVADLAAPPAVQYSTAVASEPAPVRTFLIADVRGYSRFTEEYGDEAAARLAAKFSDLVDEGVQMRGGKVVEMRGDEALAVFDSARQAIRAAKDLQEMFAQESDADRDLPLRVGIGIDSGEAVELEDGSYRGNALNVAARLCGLAHGGEVLASDGTRHLAGHIPGLRYIDRGRMNLKGISDPVHPLRIAWEDEADEKESGRWVLMFFGGPGRTLGWKLALAVVLIAAGTAGAVVYLTTGNHGERSSAAEQTTQTGGGGVSTTPALNSNLTLADLVPEKLWAGCKVQTVPEQDAIETAVCLPQSGVQGFQPDRWQISSYPNGRTLKAAYEDIRESHKIAPNQGRCNAFSWGGESPWEHGPGQPGGRLLCYFDGDDAVIVWTHGRLGQTSHKDVLLIAREGGSDHARLYGWWRPWHHLIGKAE
jgi:class 3 adenylate cyclase